VSDRYRACVPHESTDRAGSKKTYWNEVGQSWRTAKGKRVIRLHLLPEILLFLFPIEDHDGGSRAAGTAPDTVGDSRVTKPQQQVLPNRGPAEPLPPTVEGLVESTTEDDIPF